MESEEFLLLPVNQLMDIIASDELNVHSEEQVFNAVMAWTRYNVQERRGHLPMVSVNDNGNILIRKYNCLIWFKEFSLDLTLLLVSAYMPA